MVMDEGEHAFKDNVQPLLNNLVVPAEFNDTLENPDADAAIIARLEEWRKKAHQNLLDLRDRLVAKLDSRYTIDEKVEVVCGVSQFDGEGPWVSDACREVAQELLQPYDDPEIVLVERVLTQKIKPIFQYSPHPKLNPETGRRLPRPAGGTAASMDYYEGQEWKRHPGMLNTLLWSIKHIEGTAYERLWHLIIPPVMTILDDYEVRYKTRGVRAVADMLERIPPELLRRTGVGELLFTSLNKCFANLREPGTPDLLNTTIPTCIKLIELTTAPKSAQRFEQLCKVMGDGIIGSVWLYSEHDPESVQASLDNLPIILQALDIGVARYLKAIIAQLTYPLLSAPDNTTTVSLQLSSAKALCTVIDVCAPRMENWKGDILNAVCRCWVTVVESEPDDNGTDDKKMLKDVLREVCRDLASVCPSVQNDFAQILEAEPAMFSPLLGQPSSG